MDSLSKHLKNPPKVQAGPIRWMSHNKWVVSSFDNGAVQFNPSEELQQQYGSNDPDANLWDDEDHYWEYAALGPGDSW